MHYHKIDTLFDRGSDFKVDTTKLRRPEFGLIKEWYIEEKIDGMSVGFNYHRDGRVAQFFGRTANTNWNAKNKEFMENQWALMLHPASEIMDEYGLTGFTVYGELYGPGIQNGGGYRDDLGFICFDMTANDTWLNVADRNANAERMGIDVPYAYSDINDLWTAEQTWRVVKYGVYSGIKSTLLAEGVIARPPVNLYDQRGARVMWKLKGRDF